MLFSLASLASVSLTRPATRESKAWRLEGVLLGGRSSYWGASLAADVSRSRASEVHLWQGSVDVSVSNGANESVGQAGGRLILAC